MGAETATMADVEALRDEMKRELDKLRRLIDAGVPPREPPSLEERLAGVDEMEALAARILRRRGGKCLPPSYEDIGRAREERGAQVLGETAGE